MDKPIIIIGVPRSGTTLLRVLLGEHHEIGALPETPWITGAQNTASIRELVTALTEMKTGPVQTIDCIDRDDLIAASRSFLDIIVQKFLNNCGKKRPCIKTPDDIMYLEFLHELYPNAQFIHIKRDPRDVALSTLRGRYDLLGDTIHGYGRNNIENIIQRWCDWEEKIELLSSAKKCNWHHLRYEDLVTKPEQTILEVFDFVRVEKIFNIKGYSIQKHILPLWEQGSKDVVEHGGAITASRVNVWVEKIPIGDACLIDSQFGSSIKRSGYPLCSEVMIGSDAIIERNISKAEWSFLAEERMEARKLRRKRIANLPIALVRKSRRIMKKVFSCI